MLIQINIADEPQKAGISPAALPEFVDQVLATSPSPQIIGLMTIGPLVDDTEDSRPFFARMRTLLETLQQKVPYATELSMGMSGDFEIAIEEGATMVRVGSAIFGAREA